MAIPSLRPAAGAAPAEALSSTPELPAADEEALLLFLAQEAARDASRMPPSQWRHRFLENPVGQRVLPLLGSNARITDVQVGVPMRVRVEGESTTWNRHACGFAREGRPAGSTRDGHARWLERFVSPELDPLSFAACCEEDYADAIALGYEQVCSIDKLTVPTALLNTGSRTDACIREITRFDDRVDAVSAGIDAVVFVERTSAFLNWRYFDAPGETYRAALAERDGVPVGYAVVTVGSFEGSRQALIVDWWVPFDDTSATVALLDWAGARAEEVGQEQLTTVLPDTAAPWVTFQHAGFRVRPTPYYLLVNTAVKRLHTQWLNWNWYYTLADLGVFEP